MAVVATAALAIASCGLANDPTYKGRPVREWLVEAKTGIGANKDRAEATVKEMAASVTPVLIRLFGDPDPQIPPLASEAVASAGETAVPALIDTLKKERDSMTRGWCVKTLARIGSWQSLEALRAAAASDADASVRELAAKAVTAIEAAREASMPKDPTLRTLFDAPIAISSLTSAGSTALTLASGVAEIDGTPVHLNDTVTAVKAAAGAPDLAVASLTVGPSADGSSEDVLVVRNNAASGPVPAVTLGHGTRIQNVTGSDGQIVVAVKALGPRDKPCCPTVAKTLRFRYLGGNVVQVLGRPVPGGGPAF